MRLFSRAAACVVAAVALASGAGTATQAAPVQPLKPAAQSTTLYVSCDVITPGAYSWFVQGVGFPVNSARYFEYTADQNPGSIGGNFAPYPVLVADRSGEFDSDVYSGFGRNAKVTVTVKLWQHNSGSGLIWQSTKSCQNH